MYRVSFATLFLFYDTSRCDEIHREKLFWRGGGEREGDKFCKSQLLGRAKSSFCNAFAIELGYAERAFIMLLFFLESIPANYSDNEPNEFERIRNAFVNKFPGGVGGGTNWKWTREVARYHCENAFWIIKNAGTF